MVLEVMDLEKMLVWYKSVSLLTSLSLSFFICEMELVLGRNQ